MSGLLESPKPPASQAQPGTAPPAGPAVQKAPDWRVPVVIVAFVVAIALAGYFIALSSIAPSNPVSASTPVAGAGGLVKISEWPAGLGGWTVVLFRTRSETVAYARATKLADEGVSAGVIDSSQHPGWAPGYWFVFSGRYVSQQTATAAAQNLVAGGQRGAHAELVARSS